MGIKTFMDGARQVGLVPAAINRIQRARMRFEPAVSMRSKHSSAPLLCRSNTSDIHVFSQIFYMREYRCLDHVKEADFIVDCGANVGYSAAYFLSRFPKATLVAVEPDPENFRLLGENLAPYGARSKAICEGIWSHETGLVFEPDSQGTGQEWGRMVREVREGEKPDVHAIDIGSILDGSGKERISILKIDIEGSEAAVFSDNYHRWIDRVDNLVIEIHGQQCEKIFRDAIGDRFNVSHCDELTVCIRQ
jgi:FkbM family methyltransferase